MLTKLNYDVDLPKFCDVIYQSITALCISKPRSIEKEFRFTLNTKVYRFLWNYMCKLLYDSCGWC
jgi:hypothetical protein